MNNSAEMKTVELANPIMRGKKEIKEVMIRKPKGGDMRGLSLMMVAQSDYNTIVQLLPRVSEPVIHKNDLDDMDVSDLMDVSMAVAGFFIKGENPSLGTNQPVTPTA